ncbi:MAG: hypothetical protein MK108_15835 [Mariniblastus sp.]|nr:hypothetical protein [Mariniblastus sp.]
MLLPSPELMQLHETVPICLSGQELPGNCDIRYGQFHYFFMFNASGELTTVVNISRGLADRTKEGVSLPDAFLQMVDESMQVGVSLDSLERAYLESKGSPSSFQKLRHKLNEMERIGSMRVAALLRRHADDMQEPTRTRLHALALETAAVKQQVIDKRAFEHLAQQLEGFLATHPDHPEVKRLLTDYVLVALKYSFDVRQHCQQLGNRWKSQASAENSEATVEMVHQLLEVCQDHLASVDQAIKNLKSPNGWEAPRLYAQKGDGPNTLRTLEKAIAVPVMKPIYQQWREQAEAGIEKDRN